MKNRYDLIIIGGGSAAFSAAITAENLGKNVLMINAGLPWGGTCVNVGCIPSKFLLRVGEAAHSATYSLFESIRPQGVNIDFQKLMRETRMLITSLRQKKYLEVIRDFKHLTLMEGYARFKDSQTVRVNNTEYQAEKFLIATGSSLTLPDIEGLENINYLTLDSFLELKEKPESITVLGGGYIGLEMATALNRLGIKIRILEKNKRILHRHTEDISQILSETLQNEGVEILTNCEVFRVEKSGEHTLIYYETPERTKKTIKEKGYILLATGRVPNISDLGLETLSLTLTPEGHIAVNEYMQTNLPHIYAAGDVADTPAFVYTAAYEGKIAVENAFENKKIKICYAYLPWVIFTDPQVAGVGIDEQQAKKEGLPYEISILELKEVPRAIVSRKTKGFIKLIRNPKSDLLLGARIISPEAGELIQVLSMAMKYKIPVKELAENLYPYLTFSEGIKLAAISFGKDVRGLSCCAT